MHDIGFIETLQGIYHGNQDYFQITLIQLLFIGDLQQGLPFHIFHGDKEVTGLEIITRIVNLDDIWMRKPVQQPGFTQKPLHIHFIIGGMVIPHQFQGAQLFEQKMFSQINFRHTSPA